MFAEETGLSVGFARTLAGVESTWDPLEFNPGETGKDPALGLFQVRLSLWSKIAPEVGAKSWKDPVDNARVAAEVYKMNVKYARSAFKRAVGYPMPELEDEYMHYFMYQQGPSAFKLLVTSDDAQPTRAMSLNEASPRRSERVGQWRAAWRARWDRLKAASERDAGYDL